MSKEKKVKLNSKKIHERERKIKTIKIGLLIIVLFLIIIYLVLKVTYHGGSFVVNLKPNESIDSGLAMYESLYDRVGKRTLKADNLQFMDNISIKWLPSNINDAGEGSHNGDNYIAYTFYIENQGKDVLNYWYKMVIDDIVKNVDEAARIMIFINGESTVYAKGSSRDGTPEKNTEKFRDDKDGTIILKQRANLYPGEIDKITVVVWIEGDDPECIDALIGGELKMHMDITEEHHQA